MQDRRFAPESTSRQGRVNDLCLGDARPSDPCDHEVFTDGCRKCILRWRQVQTHHSNGILGGPRINGSPSFEAGYLDRFQGRLLMLDAETAYDPVTGRPNRTCFLDLNRVNRVTWFSECDMCLDRSIQVTSPVDISFYAGQLQLHFHNGHGYSIPCPEHWVPSRCAICIDRFGRPGRGLSPPRSTIHHGTTVGTSGGVDAQTQTTDRSQRLITDYFRPKKPRTE